jgi:hypothetical protein
MARFSLPTPDLKAAQAAELAVKEKLRERGEMDQKVRLLLLRVEALDVLQRIKSWFIAPPSTNALPNQSQFPKPRPIPITIAAIAAFVLLAVAFAMYRLLSFRKRKNDPKKH